MKRILITIVAALTLGLGSASAWAQFCPMCPAVDSGSEGCPTYGPRNSSERIRCLQAQNECIDRCMSWRGGWGLWLGDCVKGCPECEDSSANEIGNEINQIFDDTVQDTADHMWETLENLPGQVADMLWGCLSRGGFTGSVIMAGTDLVIDGNISPETQEQIWQCVGTAVAAGAITVSIVYPPAGMPLAVALGTIAVGASTYDCISSCVGQFDQEECEEACGRAAATGVVVAGTSLMAHAGSCMRGQPLGTLPGSVRPSAWLGGGGGPVMTGNGTLAWAPAIAEPIAISAPAVGEAAFVCPVAAEGCLMMSRFHEPGGWSQTPDGNGNFQSRGYVDFSVDDIPEEYFTQWSDKQRIAWFRDRLGLPKGGGRTGHEEFLPGNPPRMRVYDVDQNLHNTCKGSYHDTTGVPPGRGWYWGGRAKLLEWVKSAEGRAWYEARFGQPPSF